MKHYTKEEWAGEQHKGEWNDCPYFRDMVARGELPAEYIGRRTVMVGGDHGVELLTEGVHFTIEE